MKEPFRERLATVAIQSWAGHRKYLVRVIAETPTRYRIRALDGKFVQLPGRMRSISGEQTALVPKARVRFDEAAV